MLFLRRGFEDLSIPHKSTLENRINGVLRLLLDNVALQVDVLVNYDVAVA